MVNNSTFNNPNLFQKALYCLFAFIGFPFFITLSALVFINVAKTGNAAEVALLTSIVTINYIFTPLVIILALATWHISSLRKKQAGQLFNHSRIIYYCISSCRYLLAAILLQYGVSKLVGDGQLHTSYLWYGDELGKLSGFQLTWSFFSYSPFYNASIAAIEILGALFLLFRRTTLLGAVFLLPALINITLIDFNYGISAKDIISVLLLMDIFIVAICFRPLYNLFVKLEAIDPTKLVSAYGPVVPQHKWLKPVGFTIIFLFVLLTNYNQMNTSGPQPLDGAWQATMVKNHSDSIPEKNNQLRLRLFVDGQTATIKKTYQFDDFNLSIGGADKSQLSLLNISNTLHTKDVIGRYSLINKDSLVFEGKDGRDSVSWSFKRTGRPAVTN